jgi:hypothetical protein
MNSSKEKDGDEYVTLRLACRKQVVVTTYGTVEVTIPKGNRRRVGKSWDKESRLVEFCDTSNCVEWRASESSHPSHLITYVKRLPDSDHGYRCRWNLETKAWEFEKAEGDPASRVVEVTHDTK